MEVTNEEYMEATRTSMRRLSRLCDYQEQHIAALEQQVANLQQVIESMQAEEDSES